MRSSISARTFISSFLALPRYTPAGQKARVHVHVVAQLDVVQNRHAAETALCSGNYGRYPERPPCGCAILEMSWSVEDYPPHVRVVESGRCS